MFGRHRVKTLIIDHKDQRQAQNWPKGQFSAVFGQSSVAAGHLLQCTLPGYTPCSHRWYQPSMHAGRRACRKVPPRHDTGAHGQSRWPRGHLSSSTLCTSHRPTSRWPHCTSRHPTKGDPPPGEGGPISLGWAILDVLLGPSPGLVGSSTGPHTRLTRHRPGTDTYGPRAHSIRCPDASSSAGNSASLLTVAAVSQVGGRWPPLLGYLRSSSQPSPAALSPPARTGTRPAASGLWPLACPIIKAWADRLSSGCRHSNT